MDIFMHAAMHMEMLMALVMVQQDYDHRRGYGYRLDSASGLELRGWGKIGADLGCRLGLGQESDVNGC